MVLPSGLSHVAAFGNINMPADGLTRPKVSIIIPVYNAEDFLDRCIDSALGQSLSEIEVICVDDCSSDLSLSILKHRASLDKRLTILQHQENQGEGAARDAGLDAAGGDYVFHLDADDTLPDDAVEVLYRSAVANRSDLVKGGFAVVDPDGATRRVDWSSPDTRVINTNVDESLFLRRIPTSHCSYLYRREFLNTHSIRYGSDLAVGLDLVALARALLLAESVTLLPNLVYFYHQSEQSAIRGSMSARVPLDSLEAQAAVSELLRRRGFEKEANTRLQRWRYHIKEYWQRMPDNLTADQCADVFEKFRKTVGMVDVPWQLDTPVHQKYLLGLILLERDQDAVEFLRTKTAFKGFSDEADLGSGLEVILSVAPDDPGTLIETGRLASRQGDLDRALSCFERVLEKHPDHLGAKINYASVLRRTGRFDEARLLMNSTLERCLADCVHSRPAKRALAEKDRLQNAEEKQSSAALKKVIDRNESERSKLTKSLNESRLEINRTLEKSQEQQRRLDEALLAADDIRRQLKQSNTERKVIEDQLSLTNGRLAAVQSSTSWRITAPLRNLVRLVRSGR